MTLSKLKILQNRFEKSADDFRGLGFHCSELFGEDKGRVSHLPDNCIFSGFEYDDQGRASTAGDHIIACWPEHYNEGPPEYTHKPMRLENGAEFAAYLVKPYRADWNGLVALSTLEILCKEIFPYFIEIELAKNSLWKFTELFCEYQYGQLNDWLGYMDMSLTCRVLLTMQTIRKIPKNALGPYEIPAKPGESYYRETKDVFLEFAFLCTDLIDAMENHPPEPLLPKPQAKPKPSLQVLDKSADANDELISLTEAGNMLGVYPGHISRMVDKGIIKDNGLKNRSRKIIKSSVLLELNRRQEKGFIKDAKDLSAQAGLIQEDGY